MSATPPHRDRLDGRPVHVPPLWSIALVAAGGACGTAARDLLGRIGSEVGSVPWPTLTVNLLGSCALGLLTTWLARQGGGQPDRARLFWGTGFLGGFTTYSALAIETVGLSEAGRPVVAVAYGAGSVVAGFLLALAGIGVARRVRTVRR